MVARLILLLCLLPLSAFAQGWTVETYTSQSGISGQMRSPGWRMTIYCGQVLSEETGLYEENIYSGPGYLNLVSPEEFMGPISASQNGEQQVIAYDVDRQVEITLPPFYSDDLNGEGWVARIEMDHPFIQALLDDSLFILTPQLAFEFQLNTQGMVAGLIQIINHCEGASTAPVQETSIETDIDPTLFGIAQTQAFAQCQAAYDLPTSAYQSADVTGDGIDDLIVNFADLDCTEGLFADLPNGWACADGMCRIDIYSAQSIGPISLYGINVEPVPDQPNDIRLIMSQASCTSMGIPRVCAVRMRWTGQTFGSVGLE